MASKQDRFQALMDFLRTAMPGAVGNTTPASLRSNVQRQRPLVRMKSAGPVPPGASVVHRSFEPHWQARGWQRRGKTYTGYYRTRYGAYSGRIVQKWAGRLDFYVMNPPSCLNLHVHRACFWPVGGGEYYVHFFRAARTPDEGIVAVERILTESHQLEFKPQKHRR